MSAVLKPFQWILISAAAFVTMLLQGYILWLELRKRKHDIANTIIYPNVYMKIFPIQAETLSLKLQAIILPQLEMVQ